MKKRELDKRLVVVTGGGEGIGRAIVIRALEEGMVVLAGDKNAGALRELKKEVSDEFLYTVVMDVASAKGIDLLFRAAKAIDAPLFGLVNNAGIYLGKNFLDYKPEEIERVISVNLMGAIHCSQRFGKALVSEKREGAIVNISSVSAFEGSSDAIYGTAKAALNGLTKSCALLFAPYVRVNAVAPGIVQTSLIKAIPEWRLKHFRKSELVKDPIEPAAIADAVWFLLSPSSGAHMTGSILDVNNGCYMR